MTALRVAGGELFLFLLDFFFGQLHLFFLARDELEFILYAFFAGFKLLFLGLHFIAFYVRIGFELLFAFVPFFFGFEQLFFFNGLGFFISFIQDGFFALLGIGYFCGGGFIAGKIGESEADNEADDTRDNDCYFIHNRVSYLSV